MKQNIEAAALFPTLIVAMVVLMTDHGLYAFLKRVIGSYFFFWFLAMAFAQLWRIVARRVVETPASDELPRETPDHGG